MLSANETEYLLYIGTYGDGVHAFRFNPNSAGFQSLGLVGVVHNPSWVITDSAHRQLYAVSELEGTAEGGVASFAIDRKTGHLKPLNSAPSGGVAPCHLTLDNTGKVVLVANYMTGEVCLFPLRSDGAVGPLSASGTAVGCGVNRKRQECPHAHCVAAVKDTNIIYVADLGLDRLRLYRIDSSNLTLTANDPPEVELEPGFGPRHFVFSQDSKFVYLLSELRPRVTVLVHEATSGRMRVIQNIPTLPADFTEETTGAEIALHDSGRYLYTSNRGHDSIQVFAVDREQGTLNQIQIIKTLGKTPRGFTIDPSGRYLIAAGQDSNTLEFFHIDSESGLLTSGDQTFEVPSPVDVKCIPV
jgi:6-phosphogluconolactonase